MGPFRGLWEHSPVSCHTIETLGLSEQRFEDELALAASVGRLLGLMESLGSLLVWQTET